MASAPTEIRTPVLALKGLRPSPLDDGGKLRDYTLATSKGQGLHGVNTFCDPDLPINRSAMV